MAAPPRWGRLVFDPPATPGPRGVVPPGRARLLAARSDERGGLASASQACTGASRVASEPTSLRGKAERSHPAFQLRVMSRSRMRRSLPARQRETDRGRDKQVRAGRPAGRAEFTDLGRRAISSGAHAAYSAAPGVGVSRRASRSCRSVGTALQQSAGAANGRPPNLEPMCWPCRVQSHERRTAVVQGVGGQVTSVMPFIR